MRGLTNTVFFGAPATTIYVDDVPFGETKLVVRVYGEDNIRVDTNVASLVLDMDLDIGVVPGDIAHEAAVDLHPVHRQLAQVAERRQAAAEIVEGEAAAE